MIWVSIPKCTMGVGKECQKTRTKLMNSFSLCVCIQVARLRRLGGLSKKAPLVLDAILNGYKLPSVGAAAAATQRGARAALWSQDDGGGPASASQVP